MAWVGSWFQTWPRLEEMVPYQRPCRWSWPRNPGTVAIMWKKRTHGACYEKLSWPKSINSIYALFWYIWFNWFYLHMYSILQYTVYISVNKGANTFPRPWAVAEWEQLQLQRSLPTSSLECFCSSSWVTVGRFSLPLAPHLKAAESCKTWSVLIPCEPCGINLK